MKKPILSLFALLAACAFSSAQQLPNTGFESWRTSPFGELPAGNASFKWGSSDTITMYYGGDIVRPSVFKSSTSHSGNFALGLQAGRYFNSFVNDTLFGGGHLFLGEFDPNGSPLGGVPYTSRPFGITGYYRLVTPMPGMDTATVAVQFSKGGNFIGSGIQNFFPAATWQPFDININWIGTDAPDEMAVLMGMGLFDLSIDDTAARFYLDDVSLSLPTGLKQNLFASEDLKVFPNPTGGKLTVQLAGEFLKSGTYFTVHNAAGAEIARRAVQPQTEISLESQPPGTYFIQLRDGSGAVLYGQKVTLQ